jgi:hypothetical protein
MIADGAFPIYKGYGESCMPTMMDMACDPTGCTFPDAMNGIMITAGEGPLGVFDCLVIFREQTNAGPIYMRVSDLNHEHFDSRNPQGNYRFKMTYTAECPATSKCLGMWNDGMGHDLCGGRL